MKIMPLLSTLFFTSFFIFSFPVLAADADSTDYSDPPYMGSWGNIIMDQVEEDGANGGMTLRAQPQAIGTNFWDWGLQTKNQTLIEVNPGSAYDVSFKMKAESPRGIFFKFVATDLGDGTEVEYFGDWIVPEMTDEWQTYSYKKTIITNETKAFLQLQWMGANEDPTFYIDDLRITLNLDDFVFATGIAIESCPDGPVSGKLKMKASVLPDTASNRSYTWSSSNDSIAVVTMGGELIPRKSGMVDIIATSEDGGFTDTCQVEIAIENMTYYVSPDGNDANAGTGEDPGSAWKTLAHGLSMILPGDSLLIGDGTYPESDLEVKNLHAYAQHPTVIKAINPLGAVIEAHGLWAQGLMIKSCSYMEIDGLEVFNSDETGKSSGISILAGTELSLLSHHISIRNCFVHDCGCGGIGTNRAGDYVLIENNIVRDNAKRSEYNCSGISIYHPVQVDTLPGYHIIVRGNVAFENECDLPFTPGGFTKPTDGNGIIVDDLYYSQANPEEAYTQDVLIENNLSFNNGGRGINIYKSDHITVRNNTLWHNMRILNKYNASGDVNFGETKDCEFYNNIVVVDESIPSKAFGYYYVAAGMPIYNNLFVGVATFSGSFDTKDNLHKSASMQDYPLLNNPSTEVSFSSRADFRQYFGIQALSPAADAGYAESASSIDLDGLMRPTCDGFDIGAYEYTSDNYLPKVQIDAPASRSKYDLGEDFDIEVSASDCDGTVETVELYLDEEKYLETSTEPYTFSLSDLAVGTYTFKVMAIDDSGDVAPSATIEVEIKDTATTSMRDMLDEQIRVYPNPSSGKLSIEGGEHMQLKIFDMHGREVYRQAKLPVLEVLDVSVFPEGPYLLKLSGGAGIVFRKLMIGGL